MRKSEAEKKKTRQAAYLRRKQRIEEYVGSDKHISNASTGAAVGAGAASFGLTVSPMVGWKAGRLEKLRTDFNKNPMLLAQPEYLKEVERVGKISPLKTALKVSVPTAMAAKLYMIHRLKKFHKKKRIRKGWEKPMKKSASFKPISWMTRPELQDRKKKLVSQYYEPTGKTRAQGGVIGSFVAAPLMAAASMVKDPGAQKFLKKTVIPAAIVGAVAGATTAPSIRKKSITKELYKVENRLRKTQFAQIKKIQ